MTSASHIRHQSAAGKIHMRLELWSEETRLGNVFQTPGVFFSSTDAVMPDVLWISQGRLENGIDDVGHLTVVPELMAEILLPRETHEQWDKEFKLKLYSIQSV
ncbi:Uma2 family endonuclease [Halomicronema sp. CCY15110]|uniref:Uma2 family endonuclease n=1 Tax=Halomicronema sp. CCY15110 TaxID=2767773 RepID=UPI002815403C|nr:Uma2 family endonuclease [Halomicronema sp. CCY15110]